MAAGQREQIHVASGTDNATDNDHNWIDQETRWGGAIVSPWIVAFFSFAFVVLLVGSMRFQQGRMAVWLTWYRTPELPAAARNGAIVLPGVLVFLAPLVVLMVASIVGPALHVTVPDRVIGVTFLVGFGCLFLLVGFIATSTYRPPRRFYPAWLIEDDRSVGYVPPEPDLFDRLVLIVIGVPFLLLGTAALVAAIVFAFTGT